MILTNDEFYCAKRVSGTCPWPPSSPVVDAETFWLDRLSVVFAAKYNVLVLEHDMRRARDTSILRSMQCSRVNLRRLSDSRVCMHWVSCTPQRSISDQSAYHFDRLNSLDQLPELCKSLSRPIFQVLWLHLRTASRARRGCPSLRGRVRGNLGHFTLAMSHPEDKCTSQYNVKQPESTNAKRVLL